jgi:N-acetylglucosamine-6-phosphate deacetylase
MLISQPGSDYQLTQIALDAGHARDITLMLLDTHAVLDQLHLDGTQPHITTTAEAILRESGSPYTLPTLITALSEVIDELTRATRHATADIHQAQPNP